MGFDIPQEPNPAAGISLSYDEFLKAVDRMRESTFRSNVIRTGLAGLRRVAGQLRAGRLRGGGRVYAVPALWSGPRKHPVEPIAPIRPDPGRPPK